MSLCSFARDLSPCAEPRGPFAATMAALGSLLGRQPSHHQIPHDEEAGEYKFECLNCL